MSVYEFFETAARGGPKRRAAPAGGALNRGRGCHFHSDFLALSVIGLAAFAPANAADASGTPIVTPSGLTVFLHEFISEPGTQPLLRARFVAPSITQLDPDPLSVLDDMEHLCNAVAIPEAQARAEQPEQIVVSVSAEIVEFGTLDPDIVQYFEAYSVQDGTCIWELY